MIFSFFIVATLVSAVFACMQPMTNIPEAGVRQIGQMSSARAAHAATVLDDGRVLITGGFRTGGGSIAGADIFDPATGRLEATADLVTARAGHTASMLPNGKVLVAGGYNGEYLRSTEIFDPKTGRFSEGPPMTMPRSEHTATILADGRVLIAGGVGTGWTFLADAEIFDPATGGFTKAGSMSTPRESHTGTLLNDGRVLITGGHKDRRAAMTIYASSEVFDPKKNRFEPVGDLTVKRHKHAAVLLRDGRVLVAGGSDERDSRGAYDSLEVFDPKTGRFNAAGRMRNPRYKLNGTLVLLADGTVLIAGGSDGAEIFDPATGIASLTAGNFGTDRLFASATGLADGRVLIAGGYDRSNHVSSGAWLFERTAE